MSNLKIIENSLDCEILIYFKKLYRLNITKKRYLHFDEMIKITSEELGINLASATKSDFLKSWFEDINDLKFLYALMLNNFEEIIIHSSDLVHLFYKNEILNFNIPLSLDDLLLSFEVLALRENQNWNQGNPFASFNSTIHSIPCRITVLHPAMHGRRKGFKVFIRKIGNQIIPLKFFVTKEDLQFHLKSLLQNKENILISGSTGSGKTALLSSLLSTLNNKDHVIVLEDTQEINIIKDNFTYLLASDDSEYSLEKFTQYSLRMRPARIILGEMRGPEIIPFMLAMNNGHGGLMSTIHSNNARDGIERIALLFEMNIKNKSLKFSEVLKLISSNINYVIHLKDKRIHEIIKVIGSDGERINFEYIYSENKYPCKEYKAT
jgi:type IV secretion system protein VirB11